MRVQPKMTEAPFQIDELFFSVTDRRGVIMTGNEVFQRVSGYAMNELLGQPHNMIRHPDMPRCVFKLFWDTIQAGKSITAYVKNMAKDGSYYWVVATVFPLKDRYLSIRFKPSSPLLAVVDGAYKALVEVEKKEGLEASTRALGEFLASKGFSDYEAFMRTALVTELDERRKATKDMDLTTRTVGIASAFKSSKHGIYAHLSSIHGVCRELDRVYQDLYSNVDGFISLNSQMEAKSKYLLDLSEDIRLLSLNASVESNRLKMVGRTLHAVANEMKENSQQSASKISEAAIQINSVLTILQGTTFEVAAAKLQVEMITFLLGELLVNFRNSQAQPSADQVQTIRANMRYLLEGLNISTDKTLRLLSSLGEQLSGLSIQIRQIESYVRNAELIHINGNIETAKNIHAQGFHVIFQRAIRLVKTAKKELDEFRTTILTIRNETYEMRGTDRVINQSLDQIGRVLTQIM